MVCCWTQHVFLRWSLKVAVIARLRRDGTSQHCDGLLKAMQLCERFINSTAASDEAYAVLKQEVAQAMLQNQPQVKWGLDSKTMLHVVASVPQHQSICVRVKLSS